MTMTEQPSSSSSSSASNQVLQQALSAYLQPLLKKHNSLQLPSSNSDPGEGGVLTYEDLTASWKAADAILKQHAASTVVVVRILNYVVLLYVYAYPCGELTGSFSLSLSLSLH
jgi:hypothetical protein